MEQSKKIKNNNNKKERKNRKIAGKLHVTYNLYIFIAVRMNKKIFQNFNVIQSLLILHKTTRL